MNTFAQEATSDSPLEFVQYGALGLVIVALLLGWLWARPAVERVIAGLEARVVQITEDKERAEAQRDALIVTMQDKVLPVLAQTSQVNEAMKPVLTEVVKALEEFRTTMPPRSSRG